MSPPTNQATKNAGATVPVHSIKACVVYDATNGQIHHHHRVLTLVGGREPAEEEIAKDALRALSNRRKPPSGKLHVLHVAHDALEQGKRYRVDHAKQALIPEGERT
jgi:hypothetical protein